MENIKKKEKTRSKEGSTVSRNKKNILSIVYIAFFAALISVGSYIAIPIGPVPITLQVLAIYLAAGFLGWQRGTLSVIVFLLLGAIGVPVFAGGTAGIAKFISPTGGYLIGYIFVALIVGLAIKFFGKKLYVLIIAMIVGILVCYAFGTAWFMVLYNSSPDQSIGLGAALMTCVVPFLPGDAAKIAVAAVLINRLHKYIKI